MTVFTGKPIDMERINDATGGDEEFLKELVEIFLDDAVLRIEELKSALQTGDPEEVGRTAHKLKGASANMGADGLTSYAKELEALTVVAKLQEAGPLMQGLETELTRVRSTLESLIQ